GTGVARDAIAPPLVERQREGVLRALLGHVPVAGDPYEGRHHTPPLVVEGASDGLADIERGYISQTGRTSIVPQSALGICDAISIASSRPAASTREKPPRRSVGSA